MIRFIRNYFENWTRPLVFFGIAVVFTNLALLYHNRMAQITAAVLLLLALTGILVSIVYQLVKKNWQEATVTALIFGLTVFFLFLLAPTISRRLQAQPASVEHEPVVSKDIEPAKPVSAATDSIAQPQKAAMDFDVYHSPEVGYYNYAVWINKIDSGVVYLKIFDVAGNQPISPNSIPGKTSLVVYNPADSLVKFSPPAGFFIYDGSPGKPYAVRVEVWYKPDAGGPESMLLTKNYTVEGRQR